MYTLDTNAIIYFLEKEEKVTKLIENSISFDTPIYISTITEAELTSLATLTEDDIFIIETAFRQFSSLAVDSKIAQIAGTIRRKYPSVKLPDAIIASTAIFTGTSLITRNVNDFKKIKELKTVLI